MEKKKSKLIIDGNACYELDLECMEEKRREEEQKKKGRKNASPEEKGQRK